MTYGHLSTFVEVIDEALEKKTTDRIKAVAHVTKGARRRERPDSQATTDHADFDEAFNQDRPAYVKGERVIHETFGSGTILEISGFGRDLKVAVDFDTAGRKKLLVRYASLEKDYFAS